LPSRRISGNSETLAITERAEAISKERGRKNTDGKNRHTSRVAEATPGNPLIARVAHVVVANDDLIADFVWCDPSHLGASAIRHHDGAKLLVWENQRGHLNGT
jgi:hypothetical protein